MGTKRADDAQSFDEYFDVMGRPNGVEEMGGRRALSPAIDVIDQKDKLVA